MPELPEVETVRRDLAAEVTGVRILGVGWAGTPNARRVLRRHAVPAEFVDAPVGLTIRAMDRWGKFLIFRLNRGLALVAHLGMSGRLLLAAPQQPRAKHTHVVIELGGNRQLRYVDPRAFGQMFVAEQMPGGKVRGLTNLGPDPIVHGVSARHVAEEFARRRTTAKPLLMDQTFVAGLGNIYSDEVLFLSGVRHDRPTARVTECEIARIQRAIPAVLAESIAHRGTTMVDQQYRDAYGAPGSYQHMLRVYGRQAQPCPECGTPIERGRWGNRSSFYCPRCQA